MLEDPTYVPAVVPLKITWPLPGASVTKSLPTMKRSLWNAPSGVQANVPRKSPVRAPLARIPTSLLVVSDVPFLPLGLSFDEQPASATVTTSATATFLLRMRAAPQDRRAR